MPTSRPDDIDVELEVGQRSRSEGRVAEFGGAFELSMHFGKIKRTRRLHWLEKNVLKPMESVTTMLVVGLIVSPGIPRSMLRSTMLGCAKAHK